MTSYRYKDPEESWEKVDGCPQGVDFDFLIPSSRPGRGPYRITRHSAMGRITHVPGCEAFLHGHKLCRHVSEAVHRAELPAQAFLEDVKRLVSISAWWANPGAARELCGAIVRRLDDANKQLEQNARYVTLTGELAGESQSEKVDSAIRELGR
jgi:hypothetical protein